MQSKEVDKSRAAPPQEVTTDDADREMSLSLRKIHSATERISLADGIDLKTRNEAVRRVKEALTLLSLQTEHIVHVLKPANLSNARILALSTAKSADGNYLTYASQQIKTTLGPEVDTITFIPFALKDHEAYTEKVASAFKKLGLKVRSLHREEDPKEALLRAQAIFVGGGNTFRLLKDLHLTGLFPLIRKQVEAGIPYVSASAGSNLTMLNANTTNDMPISDVLLTELRGLHLFPFHLNAHYIEKQEGTTHLGESRDLRIKQFHEEQSQNPVVGLKEGGAIQCINGEVIIVGTQENPAVLIYPNGKKETLKSGQNLEKLLKA